MTDQRVRETERRWRASGAATDRVAWLQERLRAGDLRPGAARHVDALAAGRVEPGDLERRALLGDADAWAVVEDELEPRLRAAGDAAAVALAAGAPPGWDDLLAWAACASRLVPARDLARALGAAARHAADVLASTDLSGDRAEDELWALSTREQQRDAAVTAARTLLLRAERLVAGEGPVDADALGAALAAADGPTAAWWGTHAAAPQAAAWAARAALGAEPALAARECLDAVRRAGLAAAEVAGALRADASR